MADVARWRTRHRGTRSERGAAAVEFAIVFVLLIFIILMAVDLGRLFFTVQGVKAASREGARTAVIATATPNDVIARVTDSVAGAAKLSGGGGIHEAKWKTTGALATIPTSDAANENPCATGDAITVWVKVPFTWFTPALPLLGIVVGPANVPDVEAETTMRCE